MIMSVLTMSSPSRHPSPTTAKNQAAQKILALHFPPGDSAIVCPPRLCEFPSLTRDDSRHIDGDMFINGTLAALAAFADVFSIPPNSAVGFRYENLSNDFAAPSPTYSLT